MTRSTRSWMATVHLGFIRKSRFSSFGSTSFATFFRFGFGVGSGARCISWSFDGNSSRTHGMSLGWRSWWTSLRNLDSQGSRTWTDRRSPSHCNVACPWDRWLGGRQECFRRRVVALVEWLSGSSLHVTVSELFERDPTNANTNDRNEPADDPRPDSNDGEGTFPS